MTDEMENPMNDLERHNCDIFVGSLNLLQVDDDSLTDANDFTTIKAIAQTCPEIREITKAGDTPEQVVLHQVATLTERVCMTWGRPDREAIKNG